MSKIKHYFEKITILDLTIIGGSFSRYCSSVVGTANPERVNTDFRFR